MDIQYRISLGLDESAVDSFLKAEYGGYDAIRKLYKQGIENDDFVDEVVRVEWMNSKLNSVSPNGKTWAEVLFGTDYQNSIDYNNIPGNYIWYNMLENGDITIGDAARVLAPADYSLISKEMMFRKLTNQQGLGFTEMYSVYYGVDGTLEQMGMALALHVPINLFDGTSAASLLENLKLMTSDRSLIHRPSYINAGTATSTIFGMKWAIEETANSLNKAERYRNLVVNELTAPFNKLDGIISRDTIFIRYSKSDTSALYAPWSSMQVDLADTWLGAKTKGIINDFIRRDGIPFDEGFAEYVVNTPATRGQSLSDIVKEDNGLYTSLQGVDLWDGAKFSLGIFDNRAAQRGSSIHTSRLNFRISDDGKELIVSSLRKFFKGDIIDYRLTQLVGTSHMFFIGDALEDSIKIGDMLSIFEMIQSGKKIIVNNVVYDPLEFFVKWLYGDSNIVDNINGHGTNSLWMGMFEEYMEAGYDRIWSSRPGTSDTIGDNFYIRDGSIRTNLSPSLNSDVITLEAYQKLNDAHNFVFTHSRNGMAEIIEDSSGHKMIQWASGEMAKLKKYEYLVISRYGLGSLEHRIFTERFADMNVVDAFAKLIMDINDPKGIPTVMKLGDNTYYEWFDELFISLQEKYAYSFHFPFDSLSNTIDAHAAVSLIDSNGNLVFVNSLYNQMDGFISSFSGTGGRDMPTAVDVLMDDLLPDPSKSRHQYYTFLTSLSSSRDNAYSTTLIRFAPDTVIVTLTKTLDTVSRWGGKYPILAWSITPWLFARIFENVAFAISVNVIKRGSDYVINWVTKVWPW